MPASIVIAVLASVAISAAPAAPTSPPGLVEPPTPAEATACGTARNVFLRAADVALTCANGHHECAGVVTVVIANCSGVAVRVAKLELIPRALATVASPSPVKPVLSVDYDAEVSNIEARTRRTFVLRLAQVGVFRIKAHVVKPGDPDKATPQPAPVTVRVTNPARAAALAACRACRGVFGPQGMAAVDGCNCRTKDAGRACRGGDCEGACLYHAEIDGKPAGRCAEFRTTFGCHRRVGRDDHGQTTVDSICVD